MRAVELAKVAANAEALRLRQVAKRQSMRAVYGVLAAVFALGVLVLVHVVAYTVLVNYVAPVWAAAILLAADAVIAAVFGMMAMKGTPTAIELEAEAIRRQALVDLRGSVTLMALAGEAAGAVFRSRNRRLTVVRPRGTVSLAGELAARLLARR